MAGSNLITPPKIDQPEVSIFGPGYGESVLVHLGHNEWLIVDSCHDRSQQMPAPLAYLKKIGQTTEAVKLVVATHWHDDHIRGLGSITDLCKSAQFFCSSALRPEEFLQLVGLGNTRPMMRSSGTREFGKVLNVLKARTASATPTGPNWAMAGRQLWRRPTLDSGLDVPCEIHALSPSDDELTLSLYQLRSLLPKKGAPKRRIVARTPNHAAVVLWVKFQNASVLLGSDLEETPEPGTGWSVILNASYRPQEKASVFKVPHHGSEDADQPRVWTEILEPSPVALLTPYSLGDQMLPKKTDAIRICSRTSEAHITAHPKHKQSQARPSAVEKTIKEVVRNIRQVPESPGHIRIRWSETSSSTGHWTIERFGTAVPLTAICA